MNKKYIIVGAVLVIVAVIFFLLSQNNPSVSAPSPSAESAPKLKVTASFYPLYFFASEIGGDRAQVYNVTPASAEPHDYEPTAGDIARIEDSAVLVLNGGKLEPWADSIMQNINPAHTQVVIAGDELANQTLNEDGTIITDPHIWQSPILAKIMVDNIEKGLAKADPKDAEYFQSNALALESRLDDLDVSYKAGLAQCAKNDIVTSHAAFGYLATTYHLNQIPIAGLSPDAEPSPKQLADIVQFAKMHHVTYIFFESLVSPKLSDTIASEVGAKTLVLDPIEGLTDDDLKAGKNYLTVMMDNLKNLQTALQCKS